MKLLFTEIDTKSKLEKNDRFRKKIKSGENMSWEDRMTAFKSLYLKATSGVSKLKLSKSTQLYDTLISSFGTKKSLLESDYERWVMGESYLK